MARAEDEEPQVAGSDTVARLLDRHAQAMAQAYQLILADGAATAPTTLPAAPAVRAAACAVRAAAPAGQTRPPDEPHPLVPTQREIWFLDRLGPASAAAYDEVARHAGPAPARPGLGWTTSRIGDE